MFLPIPNYEEEYEINPETGEVWGIKRKIILKQGLDKYGYFRVFLCKNGKKKTIRIHRLVYMSVYPEEDIDDFQIDHIDRNRINNHWQNLRKATCAQNQCNTEANNKLGHKNIYLRKSGTYQVQIRKNGKHVFVKTYKTLEEAIENRDIQMQIHHGEFARF
jgi:hypothetical protein